MGSTWTRIYLWGEQGYQDTDSIKLTDGGLYPTDESGWMCCPEQGTRGGGLLYITW
jgi:hypothetical protein